MGTRARQEVLLVAAGFLSYFGVRAITQGSSAQAHDNARALVRLEHSLGIAWEPRLQSLVVDHHWIVTLLNWVYIWGHWPVIAAVGIWLYRDRPEAYPLIRTAFFISGAIGMCFFVVVPIAPPRLTSGFTDTVAQYSHAYRAFQPPSLVNRYAAFPSLHFGWDLLVGVALVWWARPRIARAFGVVMPVAMAVAVVFTANHWVLDVVGGGVIALVGLAVSIWWYDHAAQRRPRGLGAHPPGAAHET